MSFLGVELLFRGTRYILLGLMIILMLSGTPIAGCNQIDLVDEISTLDLGGTDPPTIEWLMPLNSTEEAGLFWDGIYTGETEISWTTTHWVNDTDGIDLVIFQYTLGVDVEWMNRTPLLLEGNFTHGRYSYTFTQSVLWDSQINWPQIEGGGMIRFRIFANDTLGNWRMTPVYFQSGGFVLIITTTTTSTNIGQPFTIEGVTLVIIAMGAAAIIIVTIVVVRRRSLGTAQ